jgi:hypothetical protein
VDLHARIERAFCFSVAGRHAPMTTRGVICQAHERTRNASVLSPANIRESLDGHLASAMHNDVLGEQRGGMR